MKFDEACSLSHVRSSIRRQAQPDVKYPKNHPVPLRVRVPPVDQSADDWEEFDPRDHEDCVEFNEMPA